MVAGLGYIIGVLTFVLGLLTQLLRDVDSNVLEARDTILDELTSSYSEFGTILAKEAIESGMFNLCVQRLRSLHCVAPKDFAKIRNIEWFMGKTLLIWFIVLTITAGSLVIGQKIFTEKQGLFLIAIPLFLLFVEAVVFVIIMKWERYLKRLMKKYKNLGYLL